MHACICRHMGLAFPRSQLLVERTGRQRGAASTVRAGLPFTKTLGRKWSRHPCRSYWDEMIRVGADREKSTNAVT